MQLWLTPISSKSLILLLILLKLFLVSLFLKTLCLVVFFLHNFALSLLHKVTPFHKVVSLHARSANLVFDVSIHHLRWQKCAKTLCFALFFLHRFALSLLHEVMSLLQVLSLLARTVNLFSDVSVYRLRCQKFAAEIFRVRYMLIITIIVGW